MSNHQKIMDSAYEKYTSNLSYEDFVRQLNHIERTAVLTGNLNYQVENGGFIQWHHNAYSSCADELFSVLKSIKAPSANTVLEVIGDVLSRFDEISDHQENVSFNDLDKRYDAIAGEFLADVESYLSYLNHVK